MERNQPSQHEPRPFAGLSDAQLMRRMETAPDFGYDDEEVELSRRLKEQGMAWKWSEDFSNPTVETYYDFTDKSESELVDMMLDLEVLSTPLGIAAKAEYMQRRAEVINKALAERALEAGKGE